MKYVQLGYHRWSVCQNNKLERSQLPTGPGVYIILIKSEKFPKGQMVYIGRTKKLKNRMFEHEVLIFLRRHIEAKNILIYHSDFGGDEKNKIELQLIEKYYDKLPFNQNKKYKPKYTVQKLFKDLNIITDNYDFKRYKVK